MKRIYFALVALMIIFTLWFSQVGEEAPSSDAQTVKVPKEEASTLERNTGHAKASLKKQHKVLPKIATLAKETNNTADKTLVLLTQNTVQNQNQQHLPFEEQDVDYQWADTFTTEIEDLFILNEKINHITLKYVECKSTQCFFSVYLDETSDSIHQAQVIGTLIKEKWPEYTFYLKSHPEPGMMKMEISRFDER